MSETSARKLSHFFVRKLNFLLRYIYIFCSYDVLGANILKWVTKFPEILLPRACNINQEQLNFEFQIKARHIEM